MTNAIEIENPSKDGTGQSSGKGGPVIGEEKNNEDSGKE